MYVFRLKQINTFHVICAALFCFAPWCSFASQAQDWRASSIFFSDILLSFLFLFVVSSNLLIVGVAVAVMLLCCLATGCACTHSCALTSVNQVKIDIFMSVSRCVGDDDGAVCCIRIHFDFNLMVIILQSKTVIFILSRAHTNAHTYTRIMKAYTAHTHTHTHNSG